MSHKPTQPTMTPELEDILLDTFAFAIVLAAQELAEVYPQTFEDGMSSTEVWKRYLLQEAIKKQESMPAEERSAFRAKHFSL